MNRFVVLATMLAGACALHKDIEFTSDRPWQFLAKFTYMRVYDGFNDTLFQWNVTGRPVGDTEIRLYNDMDGSWNLAGPLLEGGGKDAAADREICKSTGTKEGGLRYRPNRLHAAGKTQVPDGLRARVWYAFAAAPNCSSNLASGRVSLVMHNPGGWLRKEFSADRQWVAECLIALCAGFFLFISAYLVSLAVVIRAKVVDTPFHPIMKHHVSTMCIQFLAYLLFLSGSLHTAQTGYELKWLSIVGYTVDTVAQLFFLLMIVVFSMGFVVVQVHGQDGFESIQKRRSSLGLLFALLVAAHVLLLVAQFGLDGWSTTYPYATIPGILLACLRLPVLAYYGFTLRVTLNTISTRRCFYFSWGTLFALHIATLPVMLLIALLVDPWVRFQVVFVCDHVIRALLIGCMGYLLWPGARSQGLLASGYQRVVMNDQLKDTEDKDADSLDNADEEDGL